MNNNNNKKSARADNKKIPKKYMIWNKQMILALQFLMLVNLVHDELL